MSELPPRVPPWRRGAAAVAGGLRRVPGVVRGSIKSGPDAGAAPRPWVRRLAQASAIVLVSLLGVGIGLLVGGHVTQDVGPFSAQFSVVPALHGGAEIQLPPLGAVSWHSHSGPAHLEINLSALDNDRTRALIQDPNGILHASNNAAADITRGITRLVLQATAAAILGAMALGALVFRSMRRVAICGIVALSVVAGSLGIAALTFRKESLNEPRYEGLLINARTVVGDAERIATNYDQYRDQLQRLVTNVTRLYTAYNALPLYEPPDNTIKVLHISDIHLNPAAWSVIQTVVTQFNIDVVVDTGDLTDWGTEPEASFVNSIGRLKVPYVFVRGNHDSKLTEAAVRRQPNAVVLDNSVATVDGLTFAGIGDPRFTPDKTAQPTDPAAASQLDAGLRVMGQTLANTIQAYGGPVDVALTHDPATAPPLAGVVPLVLAGHLHQRQVSEMPVTPPSKYPSTLLMVEGSTGGAGLRGLESGEPLPLQLSVLYFGQNHVLQAYDEISVGGAGLSQVALDRHLTSAAKAAAAGVTPTPTG
jgi:predicted MPP superfamily phosphohydrolase